MKNLSQRTRYLVDQSHRGSVTAAARAIGLPQRTLARIVDGTSPSPRADAVRALARYYRISTDWLLTGEGVGPPDEFGQLPWAELRRWYELLMDTLRLPRPVQVALSDHAWGLSHFVDHYIPEALVDAATPQVRRLPVFLEAHRLSLASWIMTMEEWVAMHGADKVREALVNDFNNLRLGLNTAGASAYQALDSEQRENLEKLYTRYGLAQMEGEAVIRALAGDRRSSVRTPAAEVPAAEVPSEAKKPRSKRRRP